MNRASFLGVVLMMCGGSAQGPTTALAPALARIAAPDAAASTADLPAPPRPLPVSASSTHHSLPRQRRSSSEHRPPPIASPQ